MKSEEFWKELLEKNWSEAQMDQNDKNYELDFMIDILASVFTHWPELE